MTQSPVPTRNRPSHLGTRAVCPCLQFNTKTPHPISVCLEHAPEAATPAQTKYLWVIERLTIGLSSAAAYANTITLTLNNPTQIAAPIGATILFNATISAPTTNKANVFLNGDDFTVSSPLTLDDTDFFLNFPAL